MISFLLCMVGKMLATLEEEGSSKIQEEKPMILVCDRLKKEWEYEKPFQLTLYDEKNF